MIEVRVRHEEDATPVHLCWWDPTDLDGVLRMLYDHGIRDGQGNHYITVDDFKSEIVYEDGAAFYEVVFGMTE